MNRIRSFSAALLATASLLSGVAFAQAPDQGVIHGTLELDNGKQLTGTMRWGEQEILWIHHFNGDKAEPFELDSLPEEDRNRIRDNLPGPRFNVGGHTVELVRWLGKSELQPQAFGIEFGFIERLQPRGGDRVNVVFRDGSELLLDGGSDDIGADIELQTVAGDRHEVDWDDIELVRFHAPQVLTPALDNHLHGTVETRAGAFTGFVEWDHDERFPDEELDGDDESGEEQSIKFGSIASITSQGESSLVVRTDETRMVLSSTNDVNSENRGIVVTVPGFGRVDLPWTAFHTVRFHPPREPLPTYADFMGKGAIEARVVTADQTLAGNLVFDLDHSHRGEMITGHDEFGIEYRVPWYRVSRIEPASGKSSQLTLLDGRELTLGRNPDVTGGNSGLVVAASSSGPPVYLKWETVTRIETAW